MQTIDHDNYYVCPLLLITGFIAPFCSIFLESQNVLEKKQMPFHFNVVETIEHGSFQPNK